MEGKGTLKKRRALPLPAGYPEDFPLQGSTHLYFFYDLFPEGAHFGGAGNRHVFRALVLTAHTIKSPGVILDIAV